jgi:hypothetical protein
MMFPLCVTFTAPCQSPITAESALKWDTQADFSVAKWGKSGNRWRDRQEMILLNNSRVPWPTDHVDDELPTKVRYAEHRKQRDNVDGDNPAITNVDVARYEQFYASINRRR